jgi:hypothetical protein
MPLETIVKGLKVFDFYLKYLFIFYFIYFFNKVISNQRIGNEMKKILSQKFSDSFIKMFYDFKMDTYLGMFFFCFFLNKNTPVLNTLRVTKKWKLK